jgi:signal transduction histidine kinase
VSSYLSTPARDFRPATWPNSALAVALGGTLVAGWILSGGYDGSTRQIAGGVLALLPFFMIPWRPRIPVALFAAAIACEFASSALGVLGGPDLVVAIAIYTIGAERTLRATVVGVGLAVAAGLSSGLIGGGFADVAGVLAGGAAELALFSGLGYLGRTMNKRRAYVRNLVVRTEDLKRERDRLELEREQLAREAVTMERARIARELHDVVAHHVSVMVIQAGAAQATLPSDSAAAQSLESIRQTGREALAEMRRLLGLLRSEAEIDSASPIGEGARAPLPALADIEALAARTREAGLVVDLDCGRPTKLPAGVDLSAYRVIQEALTNTLRHAGVGAHVHVCLDYEPDALVVEVADDGRGQRRAATDRAPNEVGHGLVGMRERLALFGGQLEAAPRQDGGFRVVARFPIDEAPR